MNWSYKQSEIALFYNFYSELIKFWDYKFPNEIYHLKYEDYTRVRFMVLLPGGWIGPHTDKDRQGFGATNIAVNNPDGCALVMEDWGTMPFEPGAIMKINTRYNHSVWNRSDTPRVHMIVDGGMGDYFKDRCVESYKRRGGMLDI